MITNQTSLNIVNGFSDEGQGDMCPVTLVCISIHPTHSLNTILGLRTFQAASGKDKHWIRKDMTGEMRSEVSKAGAESS